MIPTISATALSRRYRDQIALDDVSLEIEPGTVTGLLGRNAATTPAALAGWPAIYPLRTLRRRLPFRRSRRCASGAARPGYHSTALAPASERHWTSGPGPDPSHGP